MLGRRVFGLAARAGSAARAAPFFTARAAAVPRAAAGVPCRHVGVKAAVVKAQPPPTPRTTTHKDHVKMKKPTKTAAHIMSQLDMEFRQKVDRSKDDPFEVGDAVMVKAFDHMSQKRPAVYKGVVISIKNKGLGTTFRILNTYDGEKFEMTFPLYSPLLGPIKILNKRHIGKPGKRLRRAKLYYLRDMPADKFQV